MRRTINTKHLMGFSWVVIRLLFVYPYKAIKCVVLSICATVSRRQPEVFTEQQAPYERIVKKVCEPLVEEIPEMCQIFREDSDTVIGVQYVDMCPDETAHIRVIGQNTFSQLYSRRVYYTKGIDKKRYFKLNNINYYLDDNKTKPIDPIQSKRGK